MMALGHKKNIRGVNEVCGVAWVGGVREMYGC